MKADVHRCVLITIKFLCLLECKYEISVPCACLKPNWLSAVHRYLASLDSTTCSIKYLGEVVAIAIGL